MDSSTDLAFSTPSAFVVPLAIGRVGAVLLVFLAALFAITSGGPENRGEITATAPVPHARAADAPLSVETKFCPRCGAGRTGSLAFCGACGFQFGVPAETAAGTRAAAVTGVSSAFRPLVMLPPRGACPRTCCPLVVVRAVRCGCGVVLYAPYRGREDGDGDRQLVQLRPASR